MRIPYRVQYLDVRSKDLVVVEGPVNSRRALRCGSGVQYAHPGDYLVVQPNGDRDVVKLPDLELYFEWIRDL